MGLGWMEENKKSGGGDVRAKALSSHPSSPEEKAASRKKSRLRRKKTAPVGVGVGGCVGVSIEGRAQNIAPLQVGG